MSDLHALYIPLDIVESIINIVAADDDHNFTTVKFCALTSRPFLQFSRKYIFETISIESLSPSASTQIPGLFKLISMNPSIASYAHHLNLRFDQEDEEGDYYARWYSDLPGILRLFTNVQYFTFGGPTIITANGRCIDWTTIPSSIQDAVSRVIGLATITSLSFAKLKQFPISQLSVGHNVRRLGLHMVEFSSENTSDANLRPIQLHEFSMGYRSSTATHTVLAAKQANDDQHIFDFSHLRSFSLRSCENEDEGAARELLLKRVTHLETFHLRVFSDIRLRPYFACLVPFMQTLKKVAIERIENGTVDPLGDLPSNLKFISRFPNVIEEFEFSFYQPSNDNCPFGCSEWAQLDKILGVSDLWPCLKSVSVNIILASITFGKSGGWLVAAKKLLRDCLRDLSSRNTVSLDIAIRHDQHGKWTEWT